jgi:hypothetical protein
LPAPPLPRKIEVKQPEREERRRRDDDHASLRRR